MHVARQGPHEARFVQDASTLEPDTSFAIVEVFGAYRTDRVVAIIHRDWAVWSDTSLSLEWRLSVFKRDLTFVITLTFSLRNPLLT